MGADGSRRSCLAVQSESELHSWHPSRPGYRVHPVPLGSSSHSPSVYPSPDSLSPTKQDFLLSLKLPEGPLDVAPEVWRQTHPPRWGGGWDFWCTPHFPSRYLLGASGARGTGFCWEEERDSQDRSKRSKCKQKGLQRQVPSPCTSLSRTVTVLDTMVRTSPRPAWCKLLGPPAPWRITQQPPGPSTGTFPSTQPLRPLQGLHSPVTPVAEAATRGPRVPPQQRGWAVGAGPGEL